MAPTTPPTGATRYDPGRGLWYSTVNGKPYWVSPLIMSGPQGTPGHGPANPGAGMVARPTWDAQKGEWNQGLNWGHVLTALMSGTVSMFVAEKLLGGGREAKAAVAQAAATGRVPDGLPDTPAAPAPPPAPAPKSLAGQGLPGEWFQEGVPEAYPGAVSSVPPWSDAQQATYAQYAQQAPRLAPEQAQPLDWLLQRGKQVTP